MFAPIHGHTLSQRPTLVLLRFLARIPQHNATLHATVSTACLVFNASPISVHSDEFYCGCVGEFLNMAFYRLLLQAFILREVSCDFNRAHSRYDATQGVSWSQFVLY